MAKTLNSQHRGTGSSHWIWGIGSRHTTETERKCTDLKNTKSRRARLGAWRYRATCNAESAGAELRSWSEDLEATAAHCSILWLEDPKHRGVWGAGPQGHREWDTVKQLSAHTCTSEERTKPTQAVFQKTQAAKSSTTNETLFGEGHRTVCPSRPALLLPLPLHSCASCSPPPHPSRKELG